MSVETGMRSKGDIPDRADVSPPGQLGTTAVGMIETIDELLSSGGNAHIYLDSVEGGDLHVYDYNSHRYVSKGWLYFHGDDRDKWVPGHNIGMIERHYE